MILVTGGAGYIGAHLIKALTHRQIPLVVLDNLSKGSLAAIENVPVVVADVGDEQAVQALFREYPITTIIHLAALTSVPESLDHPLRYYKNNVSQLIALLQAAAKPSLKYFIFSSSAAVYGTPKASIVTETCPTAPINPYGHTKLMGEQILKDAAERYGFKYLSLRYFNVAGAALDGNCGQRNPSTQLIDQAVSHALNLTPTFEVFGHDYPTPDGSAIRDLIHVEDLCSAHIDALHYLQAGGHSDVFNCGYGTGYSVKEVLTALEKITHKPLKIQYAPRREGDPPSVIACNQKIKKTLNWQPQHHSLEKILRTAYDWRLKSTKGT